MVMQMMSIAMFIHSFILLWKSQPVSHALYNVPVSGDADDAMSFFILLYKSQTVSCRMWNVPLADSGDANDSIPFFFGNHSL
jgi:hypothetical protein